MRVDRFFRVSEFLAVVLGLACLEAYASRSVLSCSGRWDFKAGESEVWRQVDVPHDATVGRSPVRCPDLGDHGYVSGGRFFYRKAIATPPEAAGGRLSLRFDGVYYDSTVSVNGTVVGGRKSGYLPFEVPLDAGRMTNLVEVTVDARTPNTRWNPGAGILRNVSLVVRRGFALEPERVFVRTVSADGKRAELRIEVEGAEIVSPKDGRLVVMHDESLLRTAGVDRKICDCTTQELDALHLQETEEKIPYLEEVLPIFEGRTPLVIEIKAFGKNHAALTQQVCELLDRFPKLQYCIESFDPRVLLWLRKHRPEIIRGQLSANFIKDRNGLSAFAAFALTHLFTNVLTMPHFVAYKYHDRGCIGAAISRTLWGVQEFSWTLRSVQEVTETKKNGALPIFELCRPDI